jgi:hypothetical protein
LLKSQFINDT